MTAVRPCPACLGHASRQFGAVDGFALVSCRSCATIFTASLPAGGEPQDYDDYYHEGNLVIPGFVERRLEEIVGSFDRYRQSNRWLDVGCGAGALMRAARSLGWEVTGTEVAPQPVERLRSEGFEVLLGDMAAIDVLRSTFDVVSMVEVLEHVPDPDVQLVTSAAALRPGGALYVTTPHARGLSARVLREGWTVVAPPEHLQLFSGPGLRAAVGRAGLVESSIRSEGADPRAVTTALRRRKPDQPIDTATGRVARAYEVNEALSTRRLGRVVKRAANATLNATRLGDGLKLVATRPT